jgi:hypothetical protein
VKRSQAGEAYALFETVPAIQHPGRDRQSQISPFRSPTLFVIVCLPGGTTTPPAVVPNRQTTNMALHDGTGTNPTGRIPKSHFDTRREARPRRKLRSQKGNSSPHTWLSGVRNVRDVYSCFISLTNFRGFV